MKSIQDTGKYAYFRKNDFNTMKQMFQQIKKSSGNTKNREILMKIMKKIKKFMKIL